MISIKLAADGKVILKDGKPSCKCCGPVYQLTIKYDWGGTGMGDLDTSTRAFGGVVGYGCGNTGNYLAWIGGDNTQVDGFEHVDVSVDTARADNLWTSSVNIECFAGWYSPRNGSGPASLIVSYKGKSQTISISPGSQSGCSSTPVATVTVFANQQPHGRHFNVN